MGVEDAGDEERVGGVDCAAEAEGGVDHRESMSSWVDLHRKQEAVVHTCQVIWVKLQGHMPAATRHFPVPL